MVQLRGKTVQAETASASRAALREAIEGMQATYERTASVAVMRDWRVQAAKSYIRRPKSQPPRAEQPKSFAVADAPKRELSERSKLSLSR